MKRIGALVALMAACFILSMSGIAQEYVNHVYIPGTNLTGGIRIDTNVTSNVPFEFKNGSYPSKVVYNTITGVAANYDGIGAANGLVLKKGDVVYDSWAEEIVFDDKAKTGGAFTIYYFKDGAPSLEIFKKAVETALKTISLKKYPPEKFAGYDAFAWKIVNPITNKEGKTSFFKANDKAYVAVTGDFSAYAEMSESMTLGGL